MPCKGGSLGRKQRSSLGVTAKHGTSRRGQICTLDVRRPSVYVPGGRTGKRLRLACFMGKLGLGESVQRTGQSGNDTTRSRKETVSGGGLSQLQGEENH